MRVFFLLGLLGLGLSSCKSTGPTSSTKGLDAFTGQKGEAVCSAAVSSQFTDRYDTFWNQGGIQGPKGYQNNLKSIFAAVPLELQSWFFLKGGKLQLIGNAKEFCGSVDATNLYRADGSVGGCLNIPKVDGLSGMPSIYVGVDAADFKSQMEQASLIVQGFAAMTSSFLTEIALAEKLSEGNDLLFEFGAYDVDMRNLKASLAFMVIEDLINNKNSDGKSYAENLPDDMKALVASSKVLDASLDRDTRWKAFWGAYGDQGHREFTNFAVAQVLDSAWCNDSTRNAVLATGSIFNKTGAYFRAEVEPVMAEAFNGTPGQTSASLADNSSSEYAEEVMAAAPVAGASFNLARGRAFPVLGAVVRAPFAVGNYFVQNKPVRSWFANHQPVRRTLWGAARFVGGAARGVAIVSGRVVGGVARVAGNGFSRMGYRVRNGCFIRRWRC
jgi:hypothetical protein